MTGLLLLAAPQLDDDSIETIDTIFEFTSQNLDGSTLAYISGQIASLPNAPFRLVKRLASDTAISVAGPVLSQSPKLGETDLCEIAATRGDSHLLAISSRSHLTLPVTDILIARGSNEVLRNIVSNKNAQISNRGAAQILDRAKDDKIIHEQLRLRADFPHKPIQNASANANPKVRDKWAKITAAKRYAVSLKQIGKLTEIKIRELANDRAYEEVLASISLLSHLEYQLIERMMHEPRLQGLTLVCKSLRFDLSTMNAVLNLAAAINGIGQDEALSARSNFVSVSTEIANSVQAAMSALHPLPTLAHDRGSRRDAALNQ